MKWASRVTLLLVFIFCGLPLLMATTRLLQELPLSTGLTSSFFLLVLKSIFFTLSQSILSTLSCIFVGGLLSLLFLFSPESFLKSVLLRIISLCGIVIFSVPSVALALLVLQLNQKTNGFIPDQGLLAIVFCHFLFSTLLFTSSTHARLEKFLLTGGRDLWDASTNLGARGFFRIKSILWPEIKKEAIHWGPLLFLICFQAFSTIIILGGHPSKTSPEVLLFFTLSNEWDSGRILVLLLTQFFFVYLVTQKIALHTQSYSWATQGLHDKSASLSNCLPKPKQFLNLFLATLLCSFLLFPFIDLLVTPMTAANYSTKLRSFLNDTSVLLPTIVLCFTTGVCFVFWALLLLFCHSKIRKQLSSWLGIGSTFLAVAWIFSGFDPSRFESSSLRLFCVALGISFCSLPLIAFWIEDRKKSIPQDYLDASCALGASPAQTIWHIEMPQMIDLFTRLFFIGFIGALGEIPLSGLFLGETETLALYSRRMALRYDFAGMDAILLCMFLFGLLYGVIQVLDSRRTRLA